jgi:hypothetical protein
LSPSGRWAFEGAGQPANNRVRRAHLSADLTRHEARSTNTRERVIVHGTDRDLKLLAARHRLKVVKQLRGAAVFLANTTVPIGERLSGRVAVRRQPIINSDASLDLGTAVDAVSPPLARCISLPLMVDAALVAVFTLYTAAPDGFTADHGRLVQIVAPHLARRFMLRPAHRMRVAEHSTRNHKLRLSPAW